MSTAIRRQDMKLRINSIIHKFYFRKVIYLSQIGGFFFFLSKKCYQTSMKSNQKICSYGNKVKQHNMMGSQSSHSIKNITVFNRSALPIQRKRLDELLLLVCGHVLANTRACLCWKTISALEQRSSELRMKIWEKDITRKMTWKAGMD